MEGMNSLAVSILSFVMSYSSLPAQAYCHSARDRRARSMEQMRHARHLSQHTCLRFTDIACRRCAIRISRTILMKNILASLHLVLDEEIRLQEDNDFGPKQVRRRLVFQPRDIYQVF
jgi:hypothetical protein